MRVKKAKELYVLSKTVADRILSARIKTLIMLMLRFFIPLLFHIFDFDAIAHVRQKKKRATMRLFCKLTEIFKITFSLFFVTAYTFAYTYQKNITTFTIRKKS